MKHINKILSAALLSIPFLAACGGGGNEPNNVVYGPNPNNNDAISEPNSVYGPSPSCTTDDDCTNYAKIWKLEGTWHCEQAAGATEGEGMCTSDAATDK